MATRFCHSAFSVPLRPHPPPPTAPKNLGLFASGRAGNAQVHRPPLSKEEVRGAGGDWAATEGARRATGVAAQSLAAARGYPWPVVKLACFGATSWHELKAYLAELAARRTGRGNGRRPQPVRPAPRGVREEERDTSRVGGGRSPAKPSSWALAAEMERYLDAHRSSVGVKTVRAVRP